MLSARDGHGARRSAAQDAIATARPDIVDRNGEILATDVKAPSLFGEPRRIIDKDEAIELLTAALPSDITTSLDNAKTRVYSRDTGLFSSPDPNLEGEVRAEAERQMQQAALDDGILKLPTPMPVRPSRAC